MNIHAARRGLVAAGVRRVWAGAGLQRAAYRGGAFCAASSTACLGRSATVHSSRNVGRRMVVARSNYGRMEVD